MCSEDKNENNGLYNDKKENNDIYHNRANHEDTINISRTTLFAQINGFIAVAIGLSDGNRALMILFTLMIILLNICWLLWGRDQCSYIRKLRDEGITRPDQKLMREKIYGKNPLKDPLTILNKIAPGIFLIGWLSLFVYLIRTYVSCMLKKL